MALRGTSVVMALAAVGLLPSSAGAQARTPDQLLVTGLETTSGVASGALRSLAKPTPSRVAKATSGLQRAITSVDAAAKIAPRAVGALEMKSMRAALRQGRSLAVGARMDVSKRRYAAARAKLRRVVALTKAAIREFGTPLTKDFPSFAVNRNFRNVPAYRDFSGVTATAGEEVVEIIIGLANRATAKAGEPDPSLGPGARLKITDMTAYQIQDPIGAYTSNRCSLDSGLILCPLRPTLRPQHSFTIAFAPKLDRGTRILVKFRTASGRRSYSVFNVR